MIKYQLLQLMTSYAIFVTVIIGVATMEIDGIATSVLPEFKNLPVLE